MRLPFLVVLVISLLEAPNLFFAVLLAGIFYLILLIKDLLIIDRKSAYEILVLILTYLLVRSFFMKAGGDFGGLSLLYSLLVAWAMSAMASSFVKNFAVSPEEGRAFVRMMSWVSFVLIWQVLIVGLFLPLDFVYQSAIVFLIATIFIDLVPRYIFGELSREKIFATSAIIFTLLVIVTASARWVL